jgi:ribosomal protein S18 acetylase RimI-like enzyme
MISKSINSAAGKFTFSINNVAVDYMSVSEFQLDLSENKHDLLVVVIQGIPPKALTDYLGSAVKFIIDSGPGRKNEFYGYVSFTEPFHHGRDGLVNGSPIQMAKLYCIGASYVFKELNSKVWDYANISEVLEHFANRHRFSVEYPKDSYKPVRLVQSNESDWMFLEKMLDPLGYAFSAHGTRLHIWDRANYDGRLSSYHIASTVSKRTDNKPFTILDFEARLGQVSSSGDSSRSLINVLDASGGIHTITDESSAYSPGVSGGSLYKLFKKPLYDSTLSIEEGLRRTKSSDNNRSIYNAKMTVFAGAGAVPGGIVDLQGFDSEFDGLWYIHDVSHVIKSQNYTTDLVLMKSDKYQVNPDISRTQELGEPPESILVQEQWVSQTIRIQEYA